MLDGIGKNNYFLMAATAPLTAPKVELPSNRMIDATIRSRLADFRAYLDETKPKRVFDPAVLPMLGVMNAELSKMLEGDSKEEDLRYIINTMYRKVNSVEKNHLSCGKACEDVIRFVLYSTLEAIRKECAACPDRIDEYLSGRIATFRYETCTETLAEKTNTHIGSFRGQFGYYNIMLESGMILEKTNYDARGNASIHGRSVHLQINLDWLFCFFLSPNSGNSALKGSQSPKGDYKDNSSSVDVEKLRLSPQLFPRPVSRLTSETPSVDGGTGIKPLTTPAPRPAELPPADLVSERWAQMKRDIYNPWNYSTNRIRINAKTAVTGMTDSEESECIKLLTQNFIKIRQDFETWAEVDQKIAIIVDRLAKYLTTNNSFYQYAPTQWLGFAFLKRTLFYYYEQYKHKKGRFSEREYNIPTAEVAEAAPQDVVAAPTFVLDHLRWLEEQGMSKIILRRYVKNKGKEWVIDCIRFARAKIARGFEPANGVVAYIIGVIKHAGHPAVTQKQADLEEERVAKGFTYADEIAAEVAKKKDREQQSTAKPTVADDPWMAEDIQNIINSHFPNDVTLRLDAAMLTRIASDATLKKVTQAQIVAKLAEMRANRMVKPPPTANAMPKPKWSVEKVNTAAQEIGLYRVSEADLTRLANRGNEINANSAQMAFWLEGIKAKKFK